MNVLHDRNGRPVAFSRSDGRTTIHLLDGLYVAEVDDECVFAADGSFLGWYVAGVIYDVDGLRVCAHDPLQPRKAKISVVRASMAAEPLIANQRQTVLPRPELADAWTQQTLSEFLGLAQPGSAVDGLG